MEQYVTLDNLIQFTIMLIALFTLARYGNK